MSASIQHAGWVGEGNPSERPAGFVLLNPFAAATRRNPGIPINISPDFPLGDWKCPKPFVVSLSNHEWPFDRLMANGFLAIEVSIIEDSAASFGMR